jgi:putative DNA primase/helicase
MHNKVTHQMIQSAINNLRSNHTSAAPKRKAVPVAIQSPLAFPVPTYLLGATSNIQLFSNPPSPSRQDVEAACPAIRLLAATGGETEEAWSLGIVNTAKFTQDPDDAAQVWSSAYPNYDSDEVSEKLAEKQGANTGPTTCERIAALDPDCSNACNFCSFNGKASSPIHAAQKLAANKGQLQAISSGQAQSTQLTSTSVSGLVPVFDPTDSGNAAWLNGWLQGCARHVYEYGYWLHFDAVTGWTKKTDAEMLRLAELAIRDMGHAGMNHLSPDEMKRFIQHVIKSLSAASLINAVTLLKGQPKVQIHADELDANPMLLGVKNGQCIDLRTGMVFELTPEHLITKSVGCEYDPYAQCPQWEAFLQQVFQEDQSLIDYLQQYVGYCLTGLTSEQQVLFGFGLGANGKSVLFSVLSELFGTYAVSAPIETFMLSGNEGPKSYLLARLAGARFVLANETADGQRLAENIIKELTGGEVIAAAHKYGHVFEFQPRFKIAMVGNHKPVIRGTDSGIWRRLHLLPFNRSFAASEQDPNLVSKLKSELSGILNWALKGVLSWQQNKRLIVPDAMKKEVETYHSESDIIGQWLLERCVVDAKATIASSVLYADYANWCRSNGHLASSQTLLGRRLSERGFGKRTGAKAVWIGLALLQPTLPFFLS